MSILSLHTSSETVALRRPHVCGETRPLDRSRAAYVDDTTGDPSWVITKAGLVGMSASLVPFQGAKIAGSDLRGAYAKDVANDAPRIDEDETLPAAGRNLTGVLGVSAGHPISARFGVCQSRWTPSVVS